MTFLVRHHLRFLDGNGLSYSQGYCDAVRCRGRTLEARLDGTWTAVAEFAAGEWRVPSGGRFVAWDAPLVASEVVT